MSHCYQQPFLTFTFATKAAAIADEPAATDEHQPKALPADRKRIS